MGYFSIDKKKEAKDARCKFTLIKKKYISTYVRFVCYNVSIFHFKCVSCLKSDSTSVQESVNLIFHVLNFSKKRRMNPMGFESGPLA